MTNADWNSAVARSGVELPRGATEPGLARVSDAVRTLAKGRFSNAGLLLALRLAASSGAVHDRLAEVDDWYRERREAARIQSGALVEKVSYPPRSLAVAVLTFLFAVIGPILAFPSVRTSSDYFMELEPAAVASGALAAVSALWVLAAEVVRIPFAGTRTRLYGPAAFVVPIALVAFALGTIGVRANAEGGANGAVPLGIALLVVALAVYIAAFVFALRNRAELRWTGDRAPAGLDQDDLDHALRSRMDDAIARASASEYDRAAAVEGVRQLFELGKLTPKRVEAVLRSLVP
jgi:hypothetical protein